MTKADIVTGGSSLLIVVAIISLFFNPTVYKASETKNPQGITVDEGRNERSTPRTFILPATPAVALLQERKDSLLIDEHQIKFCMLKLHDNGHKIVNFDDIFSIQIEISLIEYQLAKGLDVNGKFDEKTKEILGCKL